MSRSVTGDESVLRGTEAWEVIGDAQLVQEDLSLLQVPLPLRGRCGEAELGVREGGVERHAEPLGCG